MTLTKEQQIKILVDRFLAWPLPKSVRSDLCVTMDYPHSRLGTNLLTADEARQMFEYLIPAACPPPEGEIASLIKEAERIAAAFDEHRTERVIIELLVSAVRRLSAARAQETPG